MPVITIPNTFSPNTTAASAAVNANFNAIATLLNSTKLDYLNIQTGGIATLNLADGAVTTAKLANASVATAKLIDANVTRAKLAPVGQQISATCGVFSTTSTSAIDVTNLTVTITTTGRPVMLVMQGDASDAYIAATAGSSAIWGIYFLRGGVLLSGHRGAFNNQTSNQTAFCPTCVDVVAAGTYTYTIQAIVSANTLTVNNYRLMAYEL